MSPTCRILGFFILATGTLVAQGTLDDYRRAQNMLGLDPDPIVFDGQVTPNWISGENRFWYVRRGPEGKRFVLVDVAGKRQAPAFSHERLAASLTKVTGKTIQPDRLPFDSFQYDAKRKQLRFVANGANWACSPDSYECREEGRPAPRPAEVRSFAGFPGYGQALTDRMTIQAPNGKWEVLSREHNLFLRETATGQETRLTEDGSENNDYAVYPSSPTLMLELGTSNVRIPPSAYWAPDSGRFVAFRVDSRSSPRLTLVQASPKQGGLPTAYTYHAPVTGNPDVARVFPVIFDVATKQSLAVKTEPIAWLWYDAGPFRPEWSQDSSRFYFVDASRGFQHVRLKVADAGSGAVTTVVDESSAKYVNYTLAFYNWKRLGDRELLWISERDGWAHLYHYDLQSGSLKRQLTKGEWMLREVVGVFENPRRVYFYACGREPGRDPYLKHLYSLTWDTGEIRLLTPEAAEHQVSLSPDGKYVVDSSSTVNQPWTSIVRDTSDGKAVLELERGDLKPLQKLGWTPPEPFEVTAADGRTALNGVIFRPSNFDPGRKYPVIESVYAWPSGAATPKAFSVRGGSSTTGAPLSQSTAELGFIVVTLDARGTGLRSRAFQETSYRNLWGDTRWQDHIGALRQLARRYPSMDLDRVGIFGHSAGGADAVNAMLLHPEFYKVGVASSGLHDLATGMALSTEQWMGFPLGDDYRKESNLALAGQLKGKLLLAHGEVDPNVHPSSTLKLAQALIEANKDFDLLILPNQDHSLGSHRYLIRRRWDFFVRHLLQVEPPEGFDLAKKP